MLGPSSVGAPEYIGNGAYTVSYVATKVSAHGMMSCGSEILAENVLCSDGMFESAANRRIAGDTSQ